MWDDEYSWIDGDDFDEEANDEDAARLNQEEEMDAWLEEDFGVPVDDDDQAGDDDAGDEGEYLYDPYGEDDEEWLE